MFHRHRPPLPDGPLIASVLERDVALAARYDSTERDELIAIATDLLATKRWTPAAGLDLDDEVVIAMALNAAIPILAIGSGFYRNVHTIILRSGRFRSTGVTAGPVAGVVATSELPIAGQTGPNGDPIVISVEDAIDDSRRPDRARNVVIHEFAHKIDMLDGYGDGAPPQPHDRAERWRAVLADELERTDVRRSDRVLRPYAWANPGEFFAVATETFFCTPSALGDAKPVLYEALRDFYLQDPAARGEEARR